MRIRPTVQMSLGMALLTVAVLLVVRTSIPLPCSPPDVFPRDTRARHPRAWRGVDIKDGRAAGLIHPQDH